ncbi:MAG: NlpC/P60 family protein [Armatimonadota bacterium]
MGGWSGSHAGSGDQGVALSNRRVGPVTAVIVAVLICVGLAASSEGASSATGARAGAAGRAYRQRQTGKVYLVQPGECLERIARRHGLTTHALAEANGLDPDGMLRAGQYLRIPITSPQPSAKPQARYYTVKPGDSLWLLAKRHGTTQRSLAALNGLSSEAKLRIGQRLRLPGGTKPQARPAPAAPKPSLVESALKYRGVRYRYGGTTTRGMDCSGLVSRVLNSHGISAPHNSRALYRLGKPVARDDLQSGDLVFFSTRGRGISHVGIYMGDGKFVHASSGKGSVRVDTLNEGYYARRYVGARRVS